MEQRYQSLRQSNRQVTLTLFSLHAHGDCIFTYSLKLYTGAEADTVHLQMLQRFIYLFFLPVLC